jgi:hypothetical protein
MFKILVIESFTDRPERKKFWEEVIEALKDTSLSFDICGIAPVPKLLKDYNLILVHESDDHGVTAEVEKRDKPFVRYGGRKDQVEAGRISKLVIDFLPISVLKANLTTFVKKLILDGAVSVDNLQTLIGFNPLLEAKLELLHMCLTPEGAKDVDSKFPPELASYKDQIYKVSISNEDAEKAVRKILSMNDNDEITASHIVRVLSTGASGNNEFSNCFSKEYMALLSALRDALLPEHEYAK